MSYLSRPTNYSPRFRRSLIGLIVLVGFLGLSAFTARADSFSVTFTQTSFPLPAVSGTGTFTTDGVCIICTPGSGLLTFTATFMIGPPFPATDVFDITDEGGANLNTFYNRTLNEITYAAFNSESLGDSLSVQTNGIWFLTESESTTPQTGTYAIIPTPEPDSTTLFLAGVLLLGFFYRRRLLLPAHRF
jgi:hypothetical protein